MNDPVLVCSENPTHTLAFFTSTTLLANYWKNIAHRQKLHVWSISPKFMLKVSNSPPTSGVVKQSFSLLALRFSMRVQWFGFVTDPDFFEDSLPLPAQAYLKVCSAVSEASLNDVKPSSPPAILGSPSKEEALPSSGTTVQRRSVLHTEEIVRPSSGYLETLQVNLEY